MEGYVCQVCGFISIDGSAPEKCPVCMSPKDKFTSNPNVINEPKDLNNMTELEKKHVPVVVVNKKCGLIEGCADVHVKMGEIIHPMQADHYITRIDFYIDRKFISRVMLTPEHLNPGAGLHLKAAKGKLSVVELCNLHGAWIKELEL